MIRTRPLVLVAALVVSPSQAAAQEYSIGARREAYSFADPAGVGAERSWVNTVVLGAQVPLGESFNFGTRITHGSVGVQSPSGGRGELTGLADTELWLGLDLRRLTLTGSYWLPTGQTELSTGASAARGLGNDMFLRYPVVPWGGGGRASIEAVTRFGPRFAVFDARVGLASYGSFQPLADDPFEYAPGSEVYANLGVSIGFGGLTTLELSAGVRQMGVDQIGVVDIYEPGRWVDVGLSLGTQKGMTSILTSVTYLSRGQGFALEVNRADGFRDTDLVFGAWDTPSRGVIEARFDTRRPFDWGDLLTGIGVRLADQGGGSSSIATLQAGVEREIAVVRAGRLLVRPMARVGKGTAVVGAGYESGVSYLAGGVSLRWVR